MLIVQSQDKNFIGKVDEINLVSENKRFSFDNITGKTVIRIDYIIRYKKIELGKYYNLDKALKVIEDIKKHINDSNKLLVKEDGSMEVITINRVFEMPDNEEDENEKI